MQGFGENVRIGGTDKDVESTGGDEDTNQSLQTWSVDSVVIGHHNRRPIACAVVGTHLQRRR